jgi:hypothetical protein
MLLAEPKVQISLTPLGSWKPALRGNGFSPLFAGRRFLLFLSEGTIEDGDSGPLHFVAAHFVCTARRQVNINNIK